MYLSTESISRDRNLTEDSYLLFGHYDPDFCLFLDISAMRGGKGRKSLTKSASGTLRVARYMDGADNLWGDRVKPS